MNVTDDCALTGGDRQTFPLQSFAVPRDLTSRELTQPKPDGASRFLLRSATFRAIYLEVIGFVSFAGPARFGGMPGLQTPTQRTVTEFDLLRRSLFIFESSYLGTACWSRMRRLHEEGVL
jgi:hypothetical protein